jgi:acyl dehydratase
MLREAEMTTVGVLLEPFRTPPLDRVRITQFAAAMSDSNPVHADDAFCRSLGLPGIIAPGGMAVVALAHSVARRYGAESIREVDVTLKAPTTAGERLICSPEIVEILDGSLELFCRVTNEAGDVKAEGRVVVERRR